MILRGVHKLGEYPAFNFYTNFIASFVCKLLLHPSICMCCCSLPNFITYYTQLPCKFCVNDLIFNFYVPRNCGENIKHIW